jgi:hypothetical protein
VFSCRDGMTGFGRTPVLPKAKRSSCARYPPKCHVHRRESLRPLYVDTRRRPMSQMRKYRPFG